MVRRVIPLALLVLLFSSFALYCGGKKESIVARIGDREITLGDFNIAYKSISVFNRPPLIAYEDAENFLNTLINKEIMIDEAVARGMGEDETINIEMKRVELDLAIRALFKSVAEADLQITLPEVEDYYRRSRVVVKARQILVETLPEAEQVVAMLADGEDFADLAGSRSVDPRTAAAGGDMGQIIRGQVAAPVEKVAFSLKTGETSVPVQSTRGWHILQVTERIEPSMDKFEDQRHACATELRSRRRNENWKNFLDNQKAALAFVFNDESVALVNEVLPERGTLNFEWADDLSAEDRERELCTWAAGSWTVGSFVEEFGGKPGPQPYNTEGGVLVRGAVESTILNQANYEEAGKRGITSSDGVVRAVQRKREEKILNLFYADLAGDVTVSDDQVREVYEAQKENMIMPERAQIRLISVMERERADGIVRQLKAGASFENLANRHNLGKLKERSGLLDLMTREATPNELQSYAFDRLQIGEHTPVVPGIVGFYIAKLVNRDPEHPMTYDEAKVEIAPILTEQAKDETLGEWLEAKREELGVTIYPEALNLLIEGDNEETEAAAETS